MGRAQLNIGRASTVLPLALVAQSIHRLTRHDLESLTERLIEELDRRAGDPDEETGNDVEDDFVLSANAIEWATRDPTIDCVDRDGAAWTEWHNRGRHKLELGQFEVADRFGLEDAEEDDHDEDDDPIGQCDEDGINTRGALVIYGLTGKTHSGAGCPISDAGGEDDGI